MNKPNWLQANMSVGNILSILTMIVTVGGSALLTQHRVGVLEDNQAARKAEVDKEFAGLKAGQADIPQLVYRVTLAEAALKQIESRIDSGFSNFSARLDRGSESTSAGLQAITAAIGALDTRVAVLTQRLESREERRTELEDGKRVMR